MTEPGPIDHLVDFLSQPPRTRADEWLQEGFAKWLKLGDTLTNLRCLGLPASPLAVRRAQRNRYLCQAAAMLDDEVYLAVQKLHAHIVRYSRHWGVLGRLSAPPPGASDLEQVLWRAFKTLAPPTGRKMLRRIVFDGYQKPQPVTRHPLYLSVHPHPKEHDND